MNLWTKPNNQKKNDSNWIEWKMNWMNDLAKLFNWQTWMTWMKSKIEYHNIFQCSRLKFILFYFCFIYWKITTNIICQSFSAYSLCTELYYYFCLKTTIILCFINRQQQGRNRKKKIFTLLLLFQFPYIINTSTNNTRKHKHKLIYKWNVECWWLSTL